MFKDSIAKVFSIVVLALVLLYFIPVSGNGSNETTSKSSPSSKYIPPKRSLVYGNNSSLNKEDDVTGPQIQIVYVESSSKTGANYDVNGSIEQWVEELQIWLTKQTGRRLVFDTFNGKLDIPYMRIDANLPDMSPSYDLKSEYLAVNPIIPGKKFVFISDQTTKADEYWCGVAGSDAFVFPAYDLCRSNESFAVINEGFSFLAYVLLHEIIHTFGLRHVCVDDTDIMNAEPQCSLANMPRDVSTPVTFDLSRTQYYGGNLAGTDIKELPIWVISS